MLRYRSDLSQNIQSMGDFKFLLDFFCLEAYLSHRIHVWYIYIWILWSLDISILSTATEVTLERAGWMALTGASVHPFQS